MIIVHNPNNILPNSYFSITISSTDEDVLEATKINWSQLGLLVNGIAVDNLQCIMIDDSFVSKMKLKPHLDNNGNHTIVDLEDDDTGNILGQYLPYELFVHEIEDGSEKLNKYLCIAIPNVKTTYGVDLLYGKGTHELE